jgi:cytoskeletal protein CcmA (bactofilin family)
MTLSARLFGEEERSMRKDRVPTTTGGNNLNAFLGEGTSFKGTLTFEGTVRIDGRLEGEIFTKDTLVVGEGALVTASIHAGVVVISGTVRGNITAERKVDIHASGRLYGNISTPSLVIEEGVVFEGNCTMGRNDEKGEGPGEQETSLERDPAAERLFSR